MAPISLSAVRKRRICRPFKISFHFFSKFQNYFLNVYCINKFFCSKLKFLIIHFIVSKFKNKKTFFVPMNLFFFEFRNCMNIHSLGQLGIGDNAFFGPADQICFCFCGSEFIHCPRHKFAGIVRKGVKQIQSAKAEVDHRTEAMSLKFSGSENF